MSSKTKGWFIIASTLGALGLYVFLSLAFVQGLPRARVGILATLDSPTTKPVALTVALPRGYGLSASERREGWDELNKPHEADAVLGSDPVRVILPRISYCAHYAIWGNPPPPPAWFTLRLSDAPDETYTVWRAGERTGYVVRDSSRLDLPKETAAWRLNVGRLSSPEPEGTRERLWLLDVRFARQHRPPQADSRTAQAHASLSSHMGHS
jgi:hypothetical protein